MVIWVDVDADACSAQIKDMLFRAKRGTWHRASTWPTRDRVLTDEVPLAAQVVGVRMLPIFFELSDDRTYLPKIPRRERHRRTEFASAQTLSRHGARLHSNILPLF